MCSHSREVPKESDSEIESRWWSQGLGRGGEGVCNGDRVSVWDNGKALEVDSGDGCMT